MWKSNSSHTSRELIAHQQRHSGTNRNKHENNVRTYSEISGAQNCTSCLMQFSYNKPTRCTNFSNLFLEGKSTCFGQFLCPSSGVFHCTHSNGICQQRCVTYTTAVCTVKKIPDDGQRNCPKHVEFPSKNKFVKLAHLVGLL